MKKIIILAALFLAPAAHPQAINDLVQAYLSMNGIGWSNGDWETCQTEGQADRVCIWNAAKLGNQPTAYQLSAAESYWANQRQAAHFSDFLAAGIVIRCADNATVCTPAITGSYAVDESAQLKIAAAQLSIDGGHGLPGGGPLFLFKDVNGLGHMFSAAQFTAFSVKARDFYYAASIAEATLRAGQSATWPAAEILLP